MGLRTIRFVYEGIFQEILDQLGSMPLPPYIREQLETVDAIRPYMRSMPDPPRRRRPACILRRSFWSKSPQWA